jgi:hypothetical protein
MNPKFPNMSNLKASRVVEKEASKAHQAEKIEEFIMNHESNQLPF